MSVCWEGYIRIWSCLSSVPLVINSDLGDCQLQCVLGFPRHTGSASGCVMSLVILLPTPVCFGLSQTHWQHVWLYHVLGDPAANSSMFWALPDTLAAHLAVSCCGLVLWSGLVLSWLVPHFCFRFSLVALHRLLSTLLAALIDFCCIPPLFLLLSVCFVYCKCIHFIMEQGH
jgi:hypothetical protein